LSAQSSFERGGCTEIEGWRGSALTPPSGFTQQKQHLWKRSACASKEKIIAECCRIGGKNDKSREQWFCV